MAKDRTSVRMQNQIKIMKAQGLSIRVIAKALGISRKTVRKFLGEVPKEDSIPKADWQASINWDAIRFEVGKGCTIKQVHREVMPEVPYIAFWRAFREHCPILPEVTIRLHHKPGEKTQIDFCDGIDIVDPRTGKAVKTHLFVGVLPFSSYTFGEFVLDQKLPTFIGVQERMFSFFGGVTPYVVPDNLKSGVSKAHRYDPDVNPTYCDFANHTGFAVLPARPYTPKDKASGECNIGVIQRGFFNEVRNRTFYSSAELNNTFRDYLARLNSDVMKDHGVSRKDRFEEEKKFLKALPQNPFEITEWKSAKVHPDCHIQVQKNFYSVPFQYVGQAVRVRLSKKMAEVFNQEGQSIAVHSRVMGAHQFATLNSHYPEDKISLVLFDISYAKKEAQKIGPETSALVNHLFDQPYPLQFLRRVQGILRLIKSNQITSESLEHACKLAMTFNKPRLAYIKSCALYYQKNGSRPAVVVPQRDVSTMHLHQKGSA